MSEPLMFRPELDEARCQVPGCTDCSHVIGLSPECHPKRPLWVIYTEGSGELELLCSVCEEPVCRIAVAG